MGALVLCLLDPHPGGGSSSIFKCVVAYYIIIIYADDDSSLIIYYYYYHYYSYYYGSIPNKDEKILGLGLGQLPRIRSSSTSTVSGVR